jgi:hypothetical protein
MRHVLLWLLGIGCSLASCGDDSPPPVADGGGNVGPGKGGSLIGAGGSDTEGGEAQGGRLVGAGGAPEPEAGTAGLAGSGDAVGGAPPAACNQGKGATISGRILAPNGELPLPGVSVYVPSGSVDPLPNGASCWLCRSHLRGNPIALAVTDANGRFEMVNAPVGDGVPLVVQTGKWQRKLELESVVDCQDNPVDEADSQLPSRQGDGNLPSIALVSGGEDTLECLLRKLGIDDSEFAIRSGSGRVQLFSGKGGMTELEGGEGGAGGAGASQIPSGADLWSSSEQLGVFDLVLLGSETDANVVEKPAPARQLLRDYVAQGGRVLLQHHQGYFLAEGPQDVAGLATFDTQPDLPSPSTVKVDVSSPRGQMFAAWLDALNPNGTLGELSVAQGQNSVQAVSAPAVRLLYGDAPATVQAFSADLPYGPGTETCGRVTATDLLTAAGDSVSPFPSGCTSQDLSPQEQALAFLIFDLGACL